MHAHMRPAQTAVLVGMGHDPMFVGADMCVQAPEYIPRRTARRRGQRTSEEVVFLLGVVLCQLETRA